MSFQWESFDDWYTDLRYCIKDSVNGLEVLGDDGKRRKKGAALQLLMRNVSDGQFNGGTLSNKLTPTSERHDLSLTEAWRIIDISNDVNSLMTLCRHKNMLLTPRVSQLPVSEEVLVPVFIKMRTELSETQDLIRQMLEEKNSLKGASSIRNKNNLKREVYQDLCAAIAVVEHLEAMMLSSKPEDFREANIRFNEFISLVNQWVLDLEADNQSMEKLLSESGIRSADIIRFKQTSDSGELDISLKLFLKALEVDRSNKLLDAFCHTLGYRIFPLEPKEMDLSSKSVLQHFAELEGRQADTMNKLNKALEDRCVTPKELTEISEELKEEYGAELALLNEFTEFAPPTA